MMNLGNDSTIISVVLPKFLAMALTPNSVAPVSSTSLSHVLKVYPGITPFLFYRHFGKDIIADRFQLLSDDKKIDVLWLKMYRVRRRF